MNIVSVACEEKNGREEYRRCIKLGTCSRQSRRITTKDTRFKYILCPKPVYFRNWAVVSLDPVPVRYFRRQIWVSCIT